MTRDGFLQTDSTDGQPSSQGNSMPVELTYWNLCERGEAPDAQSFIRRHGLRDPGRVAAVLRMDMWRRWLNSDPIQVERYFELFPEVGQDPETEFDLVYNEYLLREQAGDFPLLDEYAARFPKLASRLRMQIDLHQALADINDLETPGGPAADTSVSPERRASTAARSVPKIPGYEILGVVGRGGMGIVYRARQIGLNRVVALKMVLAGDHAEPEQLARFHAEAEAVARLHHPNLVQIYDLGEHEGLPFLSLEYVHGGTLADLLAAGPLSAREAAELVRTLAQAMQCAHQRGIIHRDLKPANVLLARHEDERTPNSESAGNPQTGNCQGRRFVGMIPKIADFGLAKLVAEGQLTQTYTGALVGTPGYMSPEQAAGRVHDIGPAADIYSLGSILYELLSGRPPFRAATLIETLQLVLSAEPPSLSRMQPGTPRDLETVCLKCLEKEPSKRFASAAELAEDLERFLRDQPVRARRVTAWEHGWRWCRRNPLAAALVTLVATLLLTVSLVMSYYSWRLHGELERTAAARLAERKANQTAQRNLWESYLAEARARNSSGQLGQKYAALAAIEKANRLLNTTGRTASRVAALRNAVLTSLSLPDLRQEVAWNDVPADAAWVSTPSSSNRLVLGLGHDQFSVRRLPDYREIYRFSEPIELLRSPLLSSEGRFVALESSTATSVWRLEDASATRLMRLEGYSRPCFSPNERYLTALDRDGFARLLDLESGQPVRQLGSGVSLAACSFDAAGQRVAVAGRQSIQIVAVENGELLAELPGRLLDYASVVWHPNGKCVAAGSYKEGIALWDIARREVTMSFGHAGQEMQLAFDASGDFLVAHTTWNNWTSVWHSGTGARVIDLPNFVAGQLAVGPDKQLMMYRLRDNVLESWAFDGAECCTYLPRRRLGSSGFALHLSVGLNDRLLALSTEQGFELWDLEAKEKLASCPLGLNKVNLDRAGNLTVGMASGIHRWNREPAADADAGSATVLRFPPPAALTGEVAGGRVYGASADGRVLAANLQKTGWSVIHVDSPVRIVALPITQDMRDVCVTSDGRWVATAGWNSPGVAVWDSETGKLVTRLPVGILANCRFSPDGKWLATTPDGVELWRTEDWSPGPKLHAMGTAASGLNVAFSPDGKLLAVAQPNGTTLLVDPDTGEELAALYAPRLRRFLAPTFTSDGARLMMASHDEGGNIQTWDLALMRAELRRRGLDWDRPPLAAVSRRPAKPLKVRLAWGSSIGRACSDVLIREAHSLLAVNKPAEAREALRRAVDIDSESPTASNNLAWLLLTGPVSLRDPDEALRCSRHAAELKPNDPITQNTLGLALYRTGNYREATEVLEANRQPNRDFAGYDLYVLAMSYHKLDDQPRAAARLDEARQWQQAAKLSGEARLELDALRAEAEKTIMAADFR